MSSDDSPDQPSDGADLRVRTESLFAQLSAATGEEAREVRNALVRLHLPLAEYLARRFANRGEPHDDLAQVATVGLINAVDRFDATRGVAFSTFATPTIVGELKRHFRDRGWTIRVPRRLQELQLAISRAATDLTQELGRSPRVNEIAARIDATEEQVVEGLEAGSAYAPMSLDAPEPGSEVGGLIERLGAEDEALGLVLQRESVRPLLARLDPRAKRILTLRFFEDQTQSQIAAELNISQMHVSRLLSRALAELRVGLEETPST